MRFPISERTLKVSRTSGGVHLGTIRWAAVALGLVAAAISASALILKALT
jgi:hypothetical protein